MTTGGHERLELDGVGDLAILVEEHKASVKEVVAKLDEWAKLGQEAGVELAWVVLEEKVPGFRRVKKNIRTDKPYLEFERLMLFDRQSLAKNSDPYYIGLTDRGYILVLFDSGGHRYVETTIENIKWEDPVYEDFNVIFNRHTIPLGEAIKHGVTFVSVQELITRSKEVVEERIKRSSRTLHVKGPEEKRG